jgi:hypothetical protein
MEASLQARLNAIANAATREEAAARCRYWSAVDPARANLYEAQLAKWRP